MDLGVLKMDKIKKYELNFPLAYEYFLDCLNEVNELSNKVIELVEFKEGNFFTFLCDDIDANQLYQFKYGGVANGVRKKTLELVLKLVKIYNEFSVVFDNFNGDFPEYSKKPLFLDCGFHYQKEVYYALNKETVTEEKLQNCFYVSNAIWHSLCILSKAKLNPNNRELTDDQIKDICTNAQLIIITAYDAESYVFWKRNDLVIGELLETDFIILERD